MSLGLRMRRLGRWTGILAIVLLVTAAAAQAKGEWKIAEQTMTGLEAPEASIFGTASETFKLSVAWYASEIECSTLATEAPTKIFPGGTSEAILKLSSCQVLGPPFVSETCKAIEPVELKVVGELLLHGGKTYELFKAQTGETLGSVKFKEGAECPLPLSNELKGTFVGETEAGERIEQSLTLSSTVEALFGSDTLSFGTHPAILKGKSTWALAAGYKGLKWAAVGGETQKEEEEKLHKEKLEKEEKEKLVEEEELHAEELHEEELAGTWVLLRNGVSVESLNLTAITLYGALLVPELGLSIKCTEGTATAKVKRIEAGAGLNFEAHALFTGCEPTEFAKFCSVKSTGVAQKQILVTGTSEGVTMAGENTFALVENNEFTFIEMSGELCPWLEYSGLVSGSATFSLLESGKTLVNHLGHLDDEELFYEVEGWGEKLEASIDGLEGGVISPETPVLSHVTEVSGATWAIHL